MVWDFHHTVCDNVCCALLDVHEDIDRTLTQRQMTHADHLIAFLSSCPDLYSECDPGARVKPGEKPMRLKLFESTCLVFLFTFLILPSAVLAQDTPSPRAEVKESKSPADAAAIYFPNLVLVTQDNKAVHFYDDLLKGKIVLINFMFTTCNSGCSPMTANLKKVQQHLGDHLGKDIVMLSISVDPETDTPEVLKQYANKFSAQPGWYFLTGDRKNVELVLYKLGGYVEDKNKHSLVLIIGNVATGEWKKVLALANPAEIANAAMKLLDVAKK